jgi:hypothetical protein
MMVGCCVGSLVDKRVRHLSGEPGEESPKEEEASDGGVCAAAIWE